MKQSNEFIFTSAKERKRAEDLMQHPESLSKTSLLLHQSGVCVELTSISFLSESNSRRGMRRPAFIVVKQAPDLIKWE